MPFSNQQMLEGKSTANQPELFQISSGNFLVGESRIHYKYTHTTSYAFI